MNFFRMFTHLLPNARAWRLTIDKKLRQFFEGLTGLGSDIKDFVDSVWEDIYPATTREITRYEKQFGLSNTPLTEQQRRDRLDATWKALGGQDPRYIQDTLQNNGFNVFVHEWWDPADVPPIGSTVTMRCGTSFARCGEPRALCGIVTRECVPPRNPLLVLRQDTFGPQIEMACGEELAECGEASANAGDQVNPLGYPLVNKIFESTQTIAECGDPLIECGETSAECGDSSVNEGLRNYVIPNNSDKWSYFLYIGGETYPDIATVDLNRRDEFETLCLKICPTQQWLGILVIYV